MTNSVTFLSLAPVALGSKLYYCGVVYDLAHASYLQVLNRVQSAALRVCLGACQAIPIADLHVDTRELLPQLRCKKLVSRYVIEERANLNHDNYYYYYFSCY
jgi:hypothetical protein